MNAALRHFWPLVLLVPLSWGSVLAVREGISGVLMQGVNASLRSWTSRETPPDLAEWERLRGFSSQALVWAPDDPQLLQTVGAVDWWGAAVQMAQPDRSSRLLERALGYYRAAVQARPAWPDAWLYLAFAKHRAGQRDAEFQAALEAAWRRGAWSQRTIWGVAELGLEARGALSAANHQRFSLALARAAESSLPRLFRLAEGKDAVFVLCLVLADHGAARARCEKRGYSYPAAGS